MNMSKVAPSAARACFGDVPVTRRAGTNTAVGSINLAIEYVKMAESIDVKKVRKSIEDLLAAIEAKELGR